MNFGYVFRLTVVLTLVPIFQSASSSELELIENDHSIGVHLRGKPVLEYVKTEKPVPEGLSSDYRRSGYIHPVFTPQGQEVTGDFPRDHAHQHALFFAWTRTQFQGKTIDFWNQAKSLGRVEHRGVTKTERKDDWVSFTVRHAFVVGSGDTEMDALTETWKVTVHQTPEQFFLFDIESVQECASQSPVTIDQYHYGGMALRGNSQWLQDAKSNTGQASGFRFVTSEGNDRLEGNHSRPNWVAMTGRIDGHEACIAVMGSPQNFRAPQPVRLHPTKPYFCFAPMVAGEYEIEPGTKYVSRYRYLVTSTLADQEFIDRHWDDYLKGQR